MRILLVMTAGQTDVQLVVNGQRHKLDGNSCGTLHDAIAARSWTVVDAPKARSRELIKVLPEGDLTLCTPKLDAILRHFGDLSPSSALICETNRRGERDPRLAGVIMEHRLRERGVKEVTRVAFLTGGEELEDSSNEVDAVVRRAVVARLWGAIGMAMATMKDGDRVCVAPTGGLAAANEVIVELVRLHGVGGPSVTPLEVPDRDRSQQDDCAVEEQFHPAAGYRARWHALSLVEKGNLLGAWGAVSHLDGAPGQEWTQVIQWLGLFASSLSLPAGCDLPFLRHARMAVRAALRVELALRAGDIPRAVQGTVACFEAALWDHLSERTERHPRKRHFRFHAPPPAGLVRPNEGQPAATSRTQQSEFQNRPLALRETVDGVDWYRIHDNEVGAIRLADQYLRLPGLTTFAKAIAGEIRELRNDIAHSEPTPALIDDARDLMVESGLWSPGGTFVTQPIVQDVLRELGEGALGHPVDDLLAEVRRRLVEVPSVA